MPKPAGVLPPFRSPFFLGGKQPTSGYATGGGLPKFQDGIIHPDWQRWLRGVEDKTVAATSAFLFGTHAQRISAAFSPSSYLSGTVFLESDRNWFYEDSGSSWRWMSGVLFTAFASLPVDLVANDLGATVLTSDTNTLYIWNGSAWKNADQPAVIDGGPF